jgi:hypothetical protein
MELGAGPRYSAGHDEARDQNVYGGRAQYSILFMIVETPEIFDRFGL